MSESDEFEYEKVRELHAAGWTRSESVEIVRLERLVKHWPEQWGDDLPVFIFGDFDPLISDLTIGELGLVIEASHFPHSSLPGPRTVLKARARVTAKTVDGLRDAVMRLNTFVGVWTILNWADCTIGWWFPAVSRGVNVNMKPLHHEFLSSVAHDISQLESEVRKRVRRALHWMRESTPFIHEAHRSELFGMYSGTYNAFELLIEAVCIKTKFEPIKNKLENDALVEHYFARLNHAPTAKDIQRCSGQLKLLTHRKKAEHAIKTAFPKSGDRYIAETFTIAKSADRLSMIRNMINHGNMDADDPVELARIDERHTTLTMMVLGMFTFFFRYPFPTIYGDL